MISRRKLFEMALSAVIAPHVPLPAAHRMLLANGAEYWFPNHAIYPYPVIPALWQAEWINDAVYRSEYLGISREPYASQ